jgi:putative ABC transport system permease protein
VQLAVDPDPDVRRALFAHLKKLPAVEGVGVKADMVANIRETLVESQTTSLAVLLAFAGVIFFGSVLNASLVSLAERRREVATLRTLGYGSWQIGGLLLRESLLVNLAGTLVGMPIGWLLYFGVTKFHDLDFFRLPLVASPWVWVATALMSLTFALAAHLVVQWRIGRLDWLDALNVLE